MDKPTTRAQWLFTTEAVVAGGALALGAEVPVAYYFKLFTLPLAPVLGIGSLLLGSVLLGHIIYRPMKDERRRLKLFQAALADDTYILPLAEPQPVPDANALSLPYTFKLQRNWRGLAATTGAITLGAWFFISASMVRVTPISFSDWLVGSVTSALITSVLALLLLIKFSPLQWLEVTDEGIISREGANPNMLRWENIRIFAISSGKRKENPPRRYRLFRKHGRGFALDVFRPSRQRLFQFDKPALPFDEYDRQMDALLSVIAAKTGLLLYDLR